MLKNAAKECNTLPFSVVGPPSWGLLTSLAILDK